ncbi:MAG: heme-binding protein [Clostridia bacterium]|nr:heme-binding protein [Clostridia bacterium]
MMPKSKISYISLDNAKLIAQRVELKAREMGVNAVVAIADDGGNLKLCECMDNSYLASRDIAINKAYTSVALKMSTKKLSGLSQPGAPLYGIQHTNGGKIVIFGGGDTLEASGKILGGIGVSGGSEEQDTALSAYGKRVFDELFN